MAARRERCLVRQLLHCSHRAYGFIDHAMGWRRCILGPLCLSMRFDLEAQLEALASNAPVHRLRCPFSDHTPLGELVGAIYPHRPFSDGNLPRSRQHPVVLNARRFIALER